MLLHRVVDPFTEEPCYAVQRGGMYHRTNLTFGQLARLVHEGDGIITTGRAFAARPNTHPLAPLDPGKVVCVGLNYAHHAEEMGKAIPPEPLLFMKAPSAVIGAGASIERPPASELVHHEGELAVIIGATTRRTDPATASANIFGYTCANDVTARDIQRRESRYTRAKGYDTFCPLGPAIVLARDFSPPDHEVICRVNGEERQRSGLDDLICPIPELISFISHVMTLHPGDVVLTGTPAGVGPLVAGDVVEVEVTGLGVLANPVT